MGELVSKKTISEHFPNADTIVSRIKVDDLKRILQAVKYYRLRPEGVEDIYFVKDMYFITGEHYVLELKKRGRGWENKIFWSADYEPSK